MDEVTEHLQSVQKNDSIGMSKRSYMEAVIQGLRDVASVDVHFVSRTEQAPSSLNSRSTENSFNGSAKKKIYVRLLLSIDRRETTVAALETVCSKVLYSLSCKLLI